MARRRAAAWRRVEENVLLSPRRRRLQDRRRPRPPLLHLRLLRAGWPDHRARLGRADHGPCHLRRGPGLLLRGAGVEQERARASAVRLGHAARGETRGRGGLVAFGQPSRPRAARLSLIAPCRAAEVQTIDHHGRARRRTVAARTSPDGARPSWRSIVRLIYLFRRGGTVAWKHRTSQSDAVASHAETQSRPGPSSISPRSPPCSARQRSSHAP